MSHPFDHLSPGQRRRAIANYNEAADSYNKGACDMADAIASGLDAGIAQLSEDDPLLPGMRTARMFVTQTLADINSGTITMKRISE